MHVTLTLLGGGRLSPHWAKERHWGGTKRNRTNFRFPLPVPSQVLSAEIEKKKEREKNFAIAVGRGSYESLFLLNLAHLS